MSLLHDVHDKHNVQSKQVIMNECNMCFLSLLWAIREMMNRRMFGWNVEIKSRTECGIVFGINWLFRPFVKRSKTLQHLDNWSPYHYMLVKDYKALFSLRNISSHITVLVTALTPSKIVRAAKSRAVVVKNVLCIRYQVLLISSDLQ